jgi:hypothetical protein
VKQNGVMVEEDGWRQGIEGGAAGSVIACGRLYQ